MRRLTWHRGSLGRHLIVHALSAIPLTIHLTHYWRGSLSVWIALSHKEVRILRRHAWKILMWRWVSSIHALTHALRRRAPEAWIARWGSVLTSVHTVAAKLAPIVVHRRRHHTAHISAIHSLVLVHASPRALVGLRILPILVSTIGCLLEASSWWWSGRVLLLTRVSFEVCVT
jgi:hypothetical protein